jgi:DNA anti-recombination protein RmuC
MQTMRESWTDERLDDLKQEVRDGFLKVDERFNKVDERFDKIDERFDKVDERFEAMRHRSDRQFEAMQDRFDRKFDALYLLIFRFGGAAILALVGLVVTQL